MILRAILPFLQSPKFVATIGGLMSGAAGTIGVEMTGMAKGDGPLAVALVIVSSIFGAIFAALASIIRARNESVKITAEVHQDEQKNLVTEIYRVHDRERQGWENDRARIVVARERLEAINSILRASKHTALNELNTARMWIILVQILAKEKGVPLPEYEPRDMAKVAIEEDEAIQKLMGVPDHSAAPRLIPSAQPMRETV